MFLYKAKRPLKEGVVMLGRSYPGGLKGTVTEVQIRRGQLGQRDTEIRCADPARASTARSAQAAGSEVGAARSAFPF